MGWLGLFVVFGAIGLVALAFAIFSKDSVDHPSATTAE
jgi:hypothetical protein